MANSTGQFVTPLVQLDSRAQGLESRTVLFGLSSAELAAKFAELGERAYRGRQMAEAMYREWLTDLDMVTTLPKALRERMKAAGWEIGRPSVVQNFLSEDGTERYLVAGVGVGAGETVEAVWMPDGDGGERGDGSEDHTGASTGDEGASKSWNRATICVSSQVGCAVNCQFCLTAKIGFQRNLTPGEIAGQVVSVLDRQKVKIGRDRINLVFMGMGEPFLNFDNFMAAVRLLVKEVGISAQKMTVSTSGIVPGILQFAEVVDPAMRPKLAISLNAPNDAVRGEVMPINRKWPIAVLMDSIARIALRPRERVTFEYVLLAGVTDLPQHAAEVAQMVERAPFPAKVNLIAWNPGPGIPYRMPEPEQVEAFRQRLLDRGITTYLRRPRGRDIYAACGQLKRTVESSIA